MNRRAVTLPMCALGAYALAVAVPNLLTAQLLPSAPFERTVVDIQLRTAATYLDQISATIFKENGERYLTPRLVGYDKTVMTACGRVKADNAYACRSDGTIYYDRTFLAGLMSAASQRLKTDGDMAAIYAIAHEWGHQIQFLLELDYTGAVNRSETDADCLAGVMLARARTFGKVQAGDMEEARYAIQFVGDPPLTPGVWGQAIERINANAAPGSIPVITNAQGYHGNANERLAAFNRGLATSMRSCVAGIRGPRQVAAVTTIYWYVNNLAEAYDRGVAENKPIVLVSGDANGANFIRLKKETLESPILAQLANAAIFVYTDPARDIVARNIGKALGYDRLPVISLLAPNPNMIDEAGRMIGLWDAPTVLRELSKNMTKRGWLGATRAPWLPPFPGRE
ncbi:MAG: neutral zinc metallopeptidase [Gemmatimonadaceae bacterium]